MPCISVKYIATAAVSINGPSIPTVLMCVAGGLPSIALTDDTNKTQQDLLMIIYAAVMTTVRCYAIMTASY